ncbi:asparaginase [Ochrobactrum sp. RH2CCR150]|uniref:asparaginase n=1 Tax=Ochrobactrum sp. RH2CCR150 TaxID=2587044 RepID=UPI00185D88F0|nr:L-asparaginase [Ochrobactrum sp. RH2CCR150]
MNTAPNKPVVAIIATGGTIASKRGEDGASTPTLSGEDLLALVPNIDADLRPIDLMAKDSSLLTLADMQLISNAVGEALNNADIHGVVVLHGTDAMEETSLLVQLQHRLAKPVIFTGAQFTADHPHADGPANLADAVGLAIDPDNAARGVLIAFGGRVLPAWGAYKASSDSADAFRSARALDGLPEVLLPPKVGDSRIDTVAVYPGCDAIHVAASVAAGARGIVLAGLGSGNATPAIVEAVKLCTERGIPVVVSSRVPEGLLTPGYGGGGGGHDLAAAGAIHARTLRPGQARILLAALIANGSSKDAIIRAFSDNQ